MTAKNEAPKTIAFGGFGMKRVFSTVYAIRTNILIPIEIGMGYPKAIRYQNCSIDN